MQRQLIKKDPVGQNSKQDMKNCSKQKQIPTTIFYNASHLKVDLFDISEHSSQPQQVFPVNNPAKKASPESSEQSSSPFIYWDQSSQHHLNLYKMSTGSKHRSECITIITALNTEYDDTFQIEDDLFQML
ncbi:Hypothetical_protein [Hexamita inflata]|uniref:Hypothetical_protein n=1 Tax=Hexamita inflata TaxID=28002 RepID=A0AA86UGK4_9EUKA|nr:Hypothetical protein HINF_LOCUS38746 [Hexamita inflata]